MLYTARVKGQGPVEEVLIEASSEARARLVADLWGDKKGLRVIGIRAALVADESILPAEAVSNANTAAVTNTAPVKPLTK